MSARALAVLVSSAALLLGAGPARSQDFTAPRPAGPSPSALTMIEWGLVPTASGASLDAAATRWFGVSDLDTRAVAVGGSWRAARATLGLSQTGDPEIGWSAVGLACGAVDSSGGAALRIVARRDRVSGGDFDPLGAGIGVEAGGGAWFEVGGGLTVWAAVPAAWTRGAAPPLERGLEVGARLTAAELSLWAARDASASGLEHLTAGVEVRWLPLDLWVQARDRPLRGTLGVGVAVRGLTCSAAVESHPVLGETVKLALSLDPHGRR